MYCLVDVDSALSSPTGQPFIQAIYDSTKSLKATNALVAAIIAIMFICTTSENMTASRQLWSLARDNGLPRSRNIVRVNHGQPLVAMGLCCLCTAVISCLNLIPGAYALNIIASIGVGFITMSYAFCLGVLLWRRWFGDPLSPRKWSLGRAGLWINVAAAGTCAVTFIFIFWPVVYNPSP